MTPIERLLLLNQYKIMKGQGAPVEDEIEILERGYELDYRDLIPDSFLPEETCRRVVDTLQVFRVLKAYIAENPEDIEVSQNPKAVFEGFDGNDPAEGACIGYARWLAKSDRFTETLGNGERTFNSHRRMLGQYAKLVERYGEMGTPYPLTKEQAHRILA